MPPVRSNGSVRDRRIRDEGVGFANLEESYVAAGAGPVGVGALVRSLPDYIDDLTRDLGADLYGRLLKDEQVDACVEIVKLAALSAGVTIEPAVSEGDPARARAVEISDFCKRNLWEHLDREFEGHFLYDMLSALAFGNKVAEKVYYVPEVGPDAGRLCLRDLKVKPAKSVAFVVDAYLNVLGILGRTKENSGLGFGGRIIPYGQAMRLRDLDGQGAKLLPKEKFAIFTFRPVDSDPRGSSLIRPAYTPWWTKQQLMPEFLKYMSQFGTPSLVGKTAPGAARRPKVDASGEVVTSGGRTVYVEPTESMLTAVKGFRNGSIIVLPNGAELDALTVGQSSFHPFAEAFALCNRAIAKAILCQTLATEEGQFQSRAASQVHQDSLELLIRFVRVALRQFIRRHLIWQLVGLNFPADVAKALLPKVSTGETERHDFPAAASAVARLVNVGMVGSSTYQSLLNWLGLDVEVDVEEVKAEKAAAAAQRFRTPDAAEDREDEKATEGAEPEPEDR